MDNMFFFPGYNGILVELRRNIDVVFNGCG